jgi:hypothetical protein
MRPIQAFFPSIRQASKFLSFMHAKTVAWRAVGAAPDRNHWRSDGHQQSELRRTSGHQRSRSDRCLSAAGAGLCAPHWRHSPSLRRSRRSGPRRHHDGADLPRQGHGPARGHRPHSDCPAPAFDDRAQRDAAAQDGQAVTRRSDAAGRAARCRPAGQAGADEGDLPVLCGAGHPLAGGRCTQRCAGTRLSPPRLLQCFARGQDGAAGACGAHPASRAHHGRGRCAWRMGPPGPSAERLHDRHGPCGPARLQPCAVSGCVEASADGRAGATASSAHQRRITRLRSSGVQGLARKSSIPASTQA